MQDKIKKFKEESERKIGELSLKLKKKCGLTDLTDF